MFCVLFYVVFGSVYTSYLRTPTSFYLLPTHRSNFSSIVCRTNTWTLTEYSSVCALSLVLPRSEKAISNHERHQVPSLPVGPVLPVVCPSPICHIGCALIGGTRSDTGRTGGPSCPGRSVDKLWASLSLVSSGALPSAVAGVVAAFVGPLSWYPHHRGKPGRPEGSMCPTRRRRRCQARRLASGPPRLLLLDRRPHGPGAKPPWPLLFSSLVCDAVSRRQWVLREGGNYP